MIELMGNMRKNGESMEAYTGFAEVYDQFMDNIDYDGWCSYLMELLKEYGVVPQGNSYENRIVLDLGCGTGNVTGRLAKAGFDMIGLDISQEMLSVAMKKNPGDILYLMQDMREFELYGTVAAVISLCDSMNYLMETQDLVDVFRLVNNYLDPGGVFIFDLKTEYYYKGIGECVIAEDREECSFIWDNYYDEAEKVNEYQLSLFVRGEDDRYDKYVEEHFQRAYSLDEIKNALTEAGMEFVQAYGAFTKDEPGLEDERLYIIAREKGKKR